MFYLQWYLWCMPHLLLALCLVQLFRHESRRESPIFTAYLAFQLALFLMSLTMYVLIRHSQVDLETYRWLLVIGVALSSVFQLGVFYEVTSGIVVPSATLSAATWPLLRWTAGMFVLVAAVISASFSQSGTERVMNVFQVLSFSSNVINLGLLMVLVLLTRTLRLSWKSLSVGIVLGFAINSSAELGASTLVSMAGRSGYVSLDLVRMIAFHVSVLVWLIYAFLPEQGPNQKGYSISQSQLEFWDQEVQRLVRR